MDGAIYSTVAFVTSCTAECAGCDWSDVPCPLVPCPASRSVDHSDVGSRICPEVVPGALAVNVHGSSEAARDVSPVGLGDDIWTAGITGCFAGAMVCAADEDGIFAVLGVMGEPASVGFMATCGHPGVFDSIVEASWGGVPYMGDSACV